jgi:hypothetical protein
VVAIRRNEWARSSECALERSALRPGNVHSADGWQNVLAPVVARYRGKVSRLCFRADAGFANPDVYEFLEGEGSDTPYLCRRTASCRRGSATCSKRPLGRPPNEVRRFHANFTYQEAWRTFPEKRATRFGKSRRLRRRGPRKRVSSPASVDPGPDWFYCLQHPGSRLPFSKFSQVARRGQLRQSRFSALSRTKYRFLE